MSICLLTEVKDYDSTWMGDHLSSRPAVGYVGVGISLCHQTFINSSALLVSLMAMQLQHVDLKTFRPCYPTAFNGCVSTVFTHFTHDFWEGG